MVKLKNGDTLKEALLKLREYKEATHKKLKNPYHKIEEYVALLDNCFGIDGYMTHYSEAHIESLPSGQVIILVKASVDIIGEDGRVVYVMEGYGTYELTRNSEGNAYINLSTAGNNANVNALKAACTNKGAFGSRSGENEKQKVDVPGDTGSPACQQQKVSEEIKKFYITKSMERLWTDNDGKPAYRLSAQEVVDKSLCKEHSEILFYPNQYKNSIAKFNQLVSWTLSEEVTRGCAVKLKVKAVSEGKRGEGYAASYVFKAFA